MSKPDVQLYVPVRGLNRDSYDRGEGEYSTLLNGLFDSLDTGTFSLTNEMSNLLSSKFKEGFVVINTTNDINSNNTYFFLVNPITGAGEFGVIKNIQQVQNLEDVLNTCTSCPDVYDLATPLEDINQVELNVYQTLLSDQCHIDDLEPEKGFMFSIMHPIKKTAIKNEKCGKTIYFTDNYNIPRYIVIDNIGQYLTTGNIVCGVDETVPTCVDVEKMRIFKRSELLKITPISIELGGRLKLGTYEFLGAYCDAQGNEISEYTSITPPIQIFDRNNVTLSQSELATPTNYSIKLSVTNLDERYTHYKIVVIQTTLDSVGATRIFVEGIHTINDNTVIYGGEQNKEIATLSDIIRENIFVDRWELLTEANDALFGAGITRTKEMNLQPIVNFLGSYLKWQVHIGSENLYENGINSALFRGYNRDEIVPFSIRFLEKGGYKSALMPFIARQATEAELEELPIDNLDVASILANKSTCATTDRTKRWQYYNDAEEEVNCGTDLETVEVTEEETKICYIADIDTSTDGEITIQPDESYTTLREYIEDNKANCPIAFSGSDLCDKLNVTNYPAHCGDDLFADYCSEPELTDEEIEVTQILGRSTIQLTGTSGSVYIRINEVNYKATFDTSLTITATNWITENASNLAAESCTLEQSGATITIVHDLENTPTITISNLETDLDAVVSIYVSFVGVEVAFPEDYALSAKPNACNIFERDITTGDYLIDDVFKYKYLYKSGSSPSQTFWDVYLRDYSFTNSSCNTADDIINVTEAGSPYTTGYFHNYLGADTIAGIQTSKTAIGTITANWTNKIHKNSLWFRANVEGKNAVIFEVTQQNTITGDLDGIIDSTHNPNQEARISIFNSCGDTTPIYSEIVALKTAALQMRIERTATSVIFDNGVGSPITVSVANPFPNNEFFVVIDNPIVTARGVVTYVDPTDSMSATLMDRYRTAPGEGCYSVLLKNVQYSEATISWSEINFRKKETYRSTCTYNQPIINECTAFPFKAGKFAYWESQETYPDNPETFNSALMKVKPDDFGADTTAKELFEDSFVEIAADVPVLDADGYYTWKLDDTDKPITDFTCQPIKHFRFPDNKVSPFMYENLKAPLAKTLIYPLGVTIDETVINKFLDIAVINNLISDERRNNITGYEIFRGDISQDRSIVASGLLYDMRKYTEERKDIWYSNYPYNDLGADKLNLLDNGTPIPHPYDGTENNKFTFHSPETDYYKPTLPTELSVQGYMFGKSIGNVDEVKDHPKWVILTRKAKDTAGLLAGLEIAAEVAARVAQTLAATGQSYQIGVGFTEIFNPGGIGVSIAAYASDAVATAAKAIVDYGRYRLEWERIFRDLGQPKNFAYYYNSVGNYNYIQEDQVEEQQLRGIQSSRYIKEGRFIQTNDVTGEQVRINNIDREQSVYIGLGAGHPLVNPANYLNYDNNEVNFNDSSITYASENGVCVAGKSADIQRNIASPYVALKNYLPAQYGSLSSVKWLTTGFRGDLKNPRTDCLPIFGGDTFITRHTLKRKKPQFVTTAFGLADLTPFNYKFYNIIGKNPKFYADYEVTSDFSRGSALFPVIDYDLHFDCNTFSGNYYREPSKFYLFSYGVPSFLTETRVNTLLRTAEPTPERNFYPNVGDVSDWTQEKTVSIKAPNYFFYNSTYSKPVNTIASRTLSDSFNQEESDCRNDNPNGIMWSKVDSSENKYNDPFLIFNPVDFYEFKTAYGKLKDLRTIESEQILVRLENNTAIFNSVDVTIDDGKHAEAQNLLTGFARRPKTFTETDLGFSGTQGTQSVSCEFGHFHIDAKRGQVIQVMPNAEGIEEISSLIGGKPSGMRNWFKEHLPFKILKQNISGLEDMDIDNAYNGVGITMGWDSRLRRVFITKKDYIAKNIESSCINYSNNYGFYINCGNTCEEGLDLVFVIDATGSQQNSIDNIKAAIETTIVPAIIDSFGADYRLGLLTVTDGKIAGQSLFQVLEGMSVGNKDAFLAQLDLVSASGGGNPPEPTDQALLAVLNNTAAIDVNGSVVGTQTVGTFREGAAKAIILITDETPSGLNDQYTMADWNVASAIATQAFEAGIQIFPFLTSATEPTPSPPTSQPPNVTYIMQNYANVTGGTYYFAPNGNGITDSIVEAIDAIDCETEITPISLTDPTYFEDVSWTIAYSPIERKWIGWYSYKPNYYIAHQNYFQSGINQTADSEEFGLWSHLLTNKSFQVFYGKKYPFLIEYMVKRGFEARVLKTVGWQMAVQRYHNEFDVAEIENKSFDWMYVYSNRTHSGDLKLVPNTGQLSFISNYPKLAADRKSQEVLVSRDGDDYTVNYLYNRMLRTNSNQPGYLWDRNQIEKRVSYNIVKFGGKDVLETLKSSAFTVGLKATEDTRLKYTLNLIESKVNLSL